MPVFRIAALSCPMDNLLVRPLCRAEVLAKLFSLMPKDILNFLIVSGTPTIGVRSGLFYQSSNKKLNLPDR
jgi:hypothetical protein